MRLIIKSLFVLLVAAGVGCGGSSETPDEAPGETAVAEKPEEETPTEPTEEETKMPQPEDHLTAPDNVAAPPADATQTPSGLAYIVLEEPAEGAKQATTTSTVTAHYTGWTTDGKRFDSSWERGQPATFPLTKVIAGWQEGVGSMAEGELRRFWIPQDLAYKGRAGAPSGMLVFDVKLIKIEN